MAKGVDFVPDMGGIRACLKSGEVQAALGEIAAKRAATANALARSHTSAGDVYGSYVDMGQYTALGKTVITNPIVGGYIEAKHHILSGLNH